MFSGVFLGFFCFHGGGEARLFTPTSAAFLFSSGRWVPLMKIIGGFFTWTPDGIPTLSNITICIPRGMAGSPLHRGLGVSGPTEQLLYVHSWWALWGTKAREGLGPSLGSPGAWWETRSKDRARQWGLDVRPSVADRVRASQKER